MNARMQMPMQLPHNIEAEQALLGAIFINNDAYGYVAQRLEPEHFFEPLHARIYAESARLIAMGRKATPVTLKDAFPNDDIGGGLTVHKYMARLAAEATTVVNAPDYGDLVRTLATARGIIGVSGDLQRAANDLRSPDEALREAWEKLETLRSSGVIEHADRGDLADLVRKIREERASDEAPARVVSTGLADLDRDLSGGWRAGRLYVVAGRPGMGKTVVLCSSARRVAKHGGAAIYSLEIDGNEVRARLTADELARSHEPIPYRDIVAGTFSQAGLIRIEQAEDRLAQLPLRVDASGGLSMADIEARAKIDADRLAQKGTPLTVVFIDYLGLVRVSNRYRGNKVDELGEVALAAKQMAKRLGVAVVLLSQLNRGVESRDDKRPTMADLRACLVGDSLVTNADTGTRVAIRDIVNKNIRFNVWAMGSNFRLHKAQITDAWTAGLMETYRVRTRLGRTIRCSAKHRFYGLNGWHELRELTSGDTIALPREIKAPAWPQTIESGRALLLGWLIGDGYLSGSACLTSGDKDDAEFAAELGRSYFGLKPRIVVQRPERAPTIKYSGNPTYGVVFTTGRLSGAKQNGLTSWLRKLRVWGTRSYNKFIPEEIIGGSGAAVAAFLCGLFHADGSFSVGAKKSAYSVRLATISERLARDAQYLLLRFGINATVRCDSTKSSGFRPRQSGLWTVAISERTSVRTYLSRIGFLGAKHRRAVERFDWSEKKSDAGRLDRMPLELNAVVNAARTNAGITVRELKWSPEGKRLSRRFLGNLAIAVDDPKLAALAASDLIWDEIVSIEPTGPEECFDLSVGGLHNFVVDGFITHNSGEIEEHADMVGLLYRPAYYLAREANPTPDQMKAMDHCRNKLEFIIGKNRLGPTRTVNLWCDVALSAVDNAARF